MKIKVYYHCVPSGNDAATSVGHSITEVTAKSVDEIALRIMREGFWLHMPDFNRIIMPGAIISIEECK